jgi:hypothetical protein
MGLNSGIYKFVLVLHILCAIVGFGAVFLNGLYGAQVRAHPGPEGLAIFRANHLVSKVGEYFIYAVFVLGVLLVLLSDEVWEFSDTWVWGSMLLYAVGIGLSHGVVQPRLRKMEGLMEEMVAGGPPPAGATGPPPQVVQLQEHGRVIGIVGPTLDLILIAVLFLMIWKP